MKKQIGDYILSAIEMANLSQKEAASMLNVSPQTLNNYIHNNRTPDVDTLCHIIRCFHMDANQVLNIKQDANVLMACDVDEAIILREFRKLDEQHRDFAKFMLTNLPKKED